MPQYQHKGAPIASPSQRNFIEDLAIECGFSVITRNIYISSLLNRRIRGLDELYILEASKIIDELKKLKKEKNPYLDKDEFSK